MRKYGKWLLVLGILAANPAWVSADGFLGGLRQSLPLSKAAQQSRNQEKAQQVADALRRARVNGYDIAVEVRGDAVKVDGKVRDVRHRELAEQACRSVSGITSVVNNLKYVPQGQIQQTAATMSDSALRPATYNVVEGEARDIQQVHFTKPGKRSPRSKSPTPTQQMRQVARYQPSASAPPVAAPAPPVKQAAAPETAELQEQSAEPLVKTVSAPAPEPQAVVPAASEPTLPMPATAAQTAQKQTLTSAAPAKPAGPSNQQVAQHIADSLAQVGLVGYDVEIRYENGIAMLNGDVATVQQLQNAGFAASKVPGVKNVQNNLKVQGPIAQTGYGAGPRPQGAVQPAAMRGPQGMPPVMRTSMQQMQGPAMPTAIAGAGNYSNPNLPDHAWPAYAAYPNSAAITYPKQYSASAWPYIGPFYPYPQVPLGWREVSLQWDDGYWQLDFEKKHNAWYWLWNPKNWH